MSKSKKMALSILRTIGAVALIVVGAYGLKYGCEWHHNFLSEINSDLAFVCVLILVVGGATIVAEGIYQLAPIGFSIFWAALTGKDKDNNERMKIANLKRRYLW